MNRLLLKKNFIIVFIFDLILFAMSLYISFQMRFEFDIPQLYLASLKKIIIPTLVIKTVSFYLFGLYRGMWRFVSVRECLNVVKASMLSTVVLLAYVVTVYRFNFFSRTVFINDLVFTILFLSCFRLSVRLYFELVGEHRGFFAALRTLIPRQNERSESGKKLLIIGAGNAGATIVREIKHNIKLKYYVVGFLDDLVTKQGKVIHGVRVLGNIGMLERLVHEIEVDEILIAIPSASSVQMRRLVELCKKTEIEFKTVPGMGEIINGDLSVNSIREVAYRDLLGRESIKLDHEKIGGFLKDKTVLVTGAGGSIGSELCRQICKFSPDRIVLYERTECSLYEMDMELKNHFKDIDVVPYLADIQSPRQLDKAFERFKPQIVFHAAAYKHVPMMEMHPWKAVKNNILGTINVVDASTRYGVERFVQVSTDKAVRPTNVMGASKRIAEMFVQNQPREKDSKTKFMTVRFGNVIGSSGSVIPLFKRQIAEGGPVTVTHPKVNRFFMTIPEACQLILQAGSMTKGGEIYILDMGKPVNIDSMARDLIRFSGFEPGVDIEVKYVGLRPGEKLFEELITEGEGIVPTEHPKIMVLKHSPFSLSVLNNDVSELAEFACDHNRAQVIRMIKKIVPEYLPDNGIVVECVKGKEESLVSVTHASCGDAIGF